MDSLKNCLNRFFKHTVSKKSYFPVFHTNYLINISSYLRALATNLGCQQENKLELVMRMSFS